MYTIHMDKSKKALLSANIAFEEETIVLPEPIVEKEEKKEVIEEPAPKAKKSKPTSETVENENTENSN